MHLPRRALLASAALAPLARPALAAGADKIRFAASAPAPRPYHSYLFAGVPGLYAGLNLAPEFLWIAGSAAAMQVTLAGDADIANLGLADFLAAKAKMPSLPLRMIYCQDYISSYTLAIPTSSPITEIAGLRGKTVGVPSLASGAVAYTKAMLRRAGVPPEEVSIVAVGADAPAMVALRTNRVDAVNFYIGSLAGLENQGMEFRSFTAPIPSGCFVAHERLLRDRRDVAVRACQALALNTVYSQTSPQAAAKAYYLQFGMPTAEPALALKQDMHVIERTMATHKQIGDPHLWGDMTEAEWRGVLAYIGADYGLPPDAPRDTYFDSALIPAINKIDISIAVKAAQGAAPG